MNSIQTLDRPEKVRLALANVLIKGHAVPKAETIADVQKKFGLFIEKFSPERLAVALRGLCNIETNLQSDLYSFLDKITVNSELLKSVKEEEVDEITASLTEELDASLEDLNSSLEDIFYPQSLYFEDR